MAVIVKTIHGKRYGYHVYREGERVVQKYLGPLSDSQTAEAMNRLREPKEVPERFYSLFWDTDPRKLNLRRHATYILERVLDYGDFAAFRWVEQLYPGRVILNTAIASRRISPK